MVWVTFECLTAKNEKMHVCVERTVCAVCAVNGTDVCVKMHVEW